jgi:muramoyltetrapeptide carboxypeptidase LdcA involved in peptidoglycan recycling
VFELGLRRLRDEFGLIPVEYPTTRELGASPQARAADIVAAFADPDVTAIIASIGGEDQIKVLAHLDPAVLRAHPKPFLGYSDNTNLLAYLWTLGIVGYHGGSVMVQLGRGRRLHPMTEASLRAALFTSGPFTLSCPEEFGDEELDWSDEAARDREPPMRRAAAWTWHGPPTVVSGPSWGGCLEIIDVQLRAGRYLPDLAAYAGAVLLLETSEELPSATYVYRVLVGMGERGLLGQFSAVLVARAKACSLEQPRTISERDVYAEEQKDAVLRALAEYNPTAPVVIGVDFGHTDPQLVIPYGGTVAVDPVNRRVHVIY